MTNGVAQNEWSIERAARVALIVGAAGALAALVGALFNATQFFRSYLFAYIFWLTIPVGSLAVLMLHFVVGGRWGVMIRRLLEAATRTLPLIALLFVPLLFGLGAVYPWAAATHVAGDPVMAHKAGYLNAPFYIVRAVLYLGLWSILAFFLNRWSLQQDQETDPGAGKRLRRLSGPGLLIFLLTVTFASFDWLMSLEPHWYSAGYGLQWVVNHGLTAFAFAIVALSLLGGRDPFVGRLSAQHFHDLGNLLFAFVLLWAYMQYAQFHIIWSGNLPHSIPWYIRRSAGLWGWMALGLAIFHFAVPFFLLLMRHIKRNSNVLLWVASGILVMRLFDTFWMIVPSFEHPDGALHWLDFALIAGIGGLWLALFLWQLEKRPLLPLREPLLLEENTAHG